jgi:hypothetical protein
MAKGPKGERRPIDVIGNANHVMRIATGEIEDKVTDDGKNAAAVALGRMGGRQFRERSFSFFKPIQLRCPRPCRYENSLP